MIEDMQKQVELLEANPEREYTIADLRKYCIIPWARNYRTLKRIIVQDFFGENVLEARIEKLEKAKGKKHKDKDENRNRQIRYHIKGKNLIKFIKRYGPMARKPKQTWKNNQQK